MAPEAGAAGAAVLAGVAVGEMADLTEVARALVKTDRSFSPDASQSALIEDRYGAFRALFQALGPVNTALRGQAG